MLKRALSVVMGMLTAAGGAWPMEPMPCHIYSGPPAAAPLFNWPMYRPSLPPGSAMAPPPLPAPVPPVMPAPAGPPLMASPEPLPLHCVTRARALQQALAQPQLLPLPAAKPVPAVQQVAARREMPGDPVVIQPESEPAEQVAARTPPTCLPSLDPAEPAKPVSDVIRDEDKKAVFPTGCMWVGFDYLLWWIKDGPLPIPIVTFGPATGTGAIGEPGTVVLIGNDDIDFGDFTALRVRPGLWLDSYREFALEGSLFLTERKQVFQQVTSDPAGQPLLARPFLNAATGNEVGLAFSVPGETAGGLGLSASSIMHGWEANLTRMGCQVDCQRLQWLMGFRSLYLNEDIRIVEAFTGGSNVGNIPVDPQDLIGVYDRFQAVNRFYGPQLGGRYFWQRNQLGISALGKLAMGWNEQTVRIEGTSSVIPADGSAPVSVPGGVLAQVTNIGTHRRDRFAVVPELGIDLIYQVTPRLKAQLGYTLILWSNVVRPGEHMEHTLTDTLIPTSQFFGAFPTNAFFPRFEFQEDFFWAQAMSFGLTYQF